MTGAQHYVEAEKLLVAANKRLKSGLFLQTPQRQDQLVAEAQVHATLAMAAAMLPADHDPSWAESPDRIDRPTEEA